MHAFRNTSVYFLIGLSAVFLFFPGYSAYRDKEVQQGLPSYREAPFSSIPVSLYPVRTVGVLDPEMTAEGVFAIDVDSATPLFSKQSDVPFYPASTTKIMTALVSLESYSLNSVVTVMDTKVIGSRMGLVVGERITVDNLMYGLLVNSGNDAAEVLASNYPGGRDAFLARMNDKGKELGLRASHFKNPSGLPEEGHMMTAWDLGQLAVYAMRDEKFRSYVHTKDKVVFGVTGEKHILKSTNQLLGAIPGVDGVKTGYTEEAGEVLVTSVLRNNHRVVLVLLKSGDRFGETTKLIDWIYKNYTWKSFEK